MLFKTNRHLEVFPICCVSVVFQGKMTCSVQQLKFLVIKSRCVYDMYYKYKRISKEVNDYRIRMQLVDAPLVAK